MRFEQGGYATLKDDPVKVFISYSWDDDDHKEWTKHLADELLAQGVDATIDQYDLNPGDRIPLFMEESITGAVYVLVICTPKYKEKADSRRGGVGYESNLMSGELYAMNFKPKYIPILRRGTIEEALPSFLSGVLAVDLSEGLEEPVYNSHFNDLTALLKGERKKPVVAIADKKRVDKDDLAGATIYATVGEYNEDYNTFAVSLYDDDWYKADDIKRLKAGDIIVVGQGTYTVKEMTTNPYGDEPMAIMDDGTEIIFSQAGDGDMLAMSTDDDRRFTHVYSVLHLKVAPDIIYEDASDPEREEMIVTKGLEQILKIKAEKEEYSIGFDSYATTITLNDKLEIVKIHQDYDVAG